MEINRDTKLYTKDGVLLCTLGDVIQALTEGVDEAFEKLSKKKNDREFHDILFNTVGAAQAVLRDMRNILAFYGCVTVADMYDLAGLTPRYPMNSYGWTSLKNSDVIQLNDGYAIQLPPSGPIK